MPAGFWFPEREGNRNKGFRRTTQSQTTCLRNGWGTDSRRVKGFLERFSWSGELRDFGKVPAVSPSNCVIFPAVLWGRPVGAEEMVGLIQDLLSGWVQQGIWKNWVSEGLTEPGVQRRLSRVGEGSKVKERQLSWEWEGELGLNLEKNQLVFRFQKWNNSRGFETRVGLRRKWIGSRAEVKVAGGEVEKELSLWHRMVVHVDTEITEMWSWVGVKQNLECGTLRPCSVNRGANQWSVNNTHEAMWLESTRLEGETRKVPSIQQVTTNL